MRWQVRKTAHARRRRIPRKGGPPSGAAVVLIRLGVARSMAQLRGAVPGVSTLVPGWGWRRRLRVGRPVGGGGSVGSRRTPPPGPSISFRRGGPGDRTRPGTGAGPGRGRGPGPLPFLPLQLIHDLAPDLLHRAERPVRRCQELEGLPQVRGIHGPLPQPILQLLGPTLEAGGIGRFLTGVPGLQKFDIVQNLVELCFGQRLQLPQNPTSQGLVHEPVSLCWNGPSRRSGRVRHRLPVAGHPNASWTPDLPPGRDVPHLVEGCSRSTGTTEKRSRGGRALNALRDHGVSRSVGASCTPSTSF